MADGHHFENCYISISQPRITRIWRNLVYGLKFWLWRQKCDKNSEIHKLKMADGRHIENYFFGYNSASYCPIKMKFGVRRHNRTRAKVSWRKCLIWKSNMADGRHFENHYISISQPQIIRNLVCRHKFSLRRRKQQKSEIRKFKMAYGCRIENHFLAITQLHVVPLRWNFEWGGRITRTWRRSARWSKCLIKKIQNGGRQHFENHHTSVSEPQLVQIWRNLVCKRTFWHSRGNINKHK